MIQLFQDFKKNVLQKAVVPDTMVMTVKAFVLQPLNYIQTLENNFINYLIKQIEQ